MGEKKAKEPWLAILLSYILPGLGQVYAASVYRGLVLLGGSTIAILGIISWMNFLVSPYNKISILHWLGYIVTCCLILGFHVFSMIDGYICASRYNEKNATGTAHIPTRIVAVVVLTVMIVLLANYLTPLVQYYAYNYYLGISLGDSMRPTIENEDIILEKYVSNYVPQRGKIIAFKSPRHTVEDFCKRVIGVPGDTIEIRDKTVFVNGQRLFETYIMHNDSLDFSRFSDKFVIPKELQKRDAMAPVTIPEGKCFVLGDNRDLSDDSRYFGLVSLRDVDCEIIKIIWPPRRSGVIE
ncbi:MAG: signal peptidase I [bacterium]|nr:signal peptidase I [bacterium]